VIEIVSADALTFDRDGAVRHSRAALSILRHLAHLASQLPQDCAGTRIAKVPLLATLIQPGGVADGIAKAYLGRGARPVRAILFDKTARQNWALGWHQDRTIWVQSRHDKSGFGPWTVKQGLVHVEPPFALIERMITMRLHLDPVPVDNAPLLIAPGSHRLGRIAERDIDGVVARCGAHACLAEPGDIWVYATPILHASHPAQGARRRVLQLDYSTDRLPAPLQWGMSGTEHDRAAT
jgi:hypothetical protein